MKDRYKDTLSVADEISETLGSGENIKPGQLTKLLDAYNRDTMKEDKVRSMVALTIANAIDERLKSSGYDYKYEFRGDTAYLNVSLIRDSLVRFTITSENLSSIMANMTSTLDTLSTLLSRNGPFMVLSSQSL